MATANDMNRGMAIIHRGEIYIVKDFSHQKPGKGGAFLQVSLKSPKTGKIINERFRSTETIEPAFIETKMFQYLYSDDTGHIFMDTGTFEQVTFTNEAIGGQARFLTDGIEVKVQMHKDEPIQIVLPASVTTVVKYAQPGEKGDSATNNFKAVETELGFEVQVPLFIRTGDRIKINTETGGYMGKDN